MLVVGGTGEPAGIVWRGDLLRARYCASRKYVPPLSGSTSC